MITINDLKRVSKLTIAQLRALSTRQKQTLRGKVVDARNEQHRKHWSGHGDRLITDMKNLKLWLTSWPYGKAVIVEVIEARKNTPDLYYIRKPGGRTDTTSADFLFDIPHELIGEYHTDCDVLIKRIKELENALGEAHNFALLVESWGRTNCEIYKHELKASADLSLERIEKVITDFNE